jgi:hypothetical protein
MPTSTLKSSTCFHAQTDVREWENGPEDWHLLVSAFAKSHCNRLICGTLLVAGIWTVIHGLTAEKFTVPSLGWLPGQEREQYVPKWYHRVFVILAGLGVAGFAWCGLIGFHQPH